MLILIQGESGKGTTTDSNGKFELKNLDKSIYTLEIRYTGYQSQFITTSSKDTISIKLPHGIDEGQFLRVQGKGDFKDGMYGNLVVKFVKTETKKI